MESLFPIQMVLAEFDIDTGSCVRARYPDINLPCNHLPHDSPSGSPTKAHGDGGGAAWEHYLADQMLPDGAEKHPNSKTVFVLNRPPVKSQHYRRFQVHTFRATVDPQEPSPRQEALCPVEGGSHEPSVNGDNDGTSHEAPLSSDPLFLWCRACASLPDGFVPEDLAVDVVSGGVRLMDKYGTILFSDVALQQHSVVVSPQMPDVVQLFARQVQIYRQGGMWEDVIFDPTVEGSSAITPTLVPAQHEAAQVLTSTAAPPSSLSSAASFVFCLLTPTLTSLGGAVEPIGILMSASDFGLFSALESFPMDACGGGSPQSPAPSNVPTEDSLAFRPSMVAVPEFNFSGVLSDDDPSLVGDGSFRGTAGATLFGVCAAITRKDAEVRRGGINKSVALIGPSYPLIEPFFSLLVDTAEKCCEIKGKGEGEIRQQVAILKRAFDAIIAALQETELQRSASKLSQLDRRAYCTAGGDRSSALVASTIVSAPHGRKHKFVVPHLDGRSAGGFYLAPLTTTAPLVRLVQGLKDKLFLLLAALLGRRRVVVYSRSLPSTHVCETVLALGGWLEAVDASFVRQRVFPYTSINHMCLFNTIPGFVVGTLNPMFESQKSWWDVLVDISAEEATLVTSNADMDSFLFMHHDRCSFHACDKDAYRELHRGMVHRRAGLQAADGELERFVEDFLGEYLRSCVTFAQFGGPRCTLGRALPARLVDAFSGAQRSRMERWVSTDLHDALLAYARTHDATASFLVACLRRSQSFEDFEIVQLVQEMLRSSHERGLVHLLSQFPLSLGGVATLAAKMVHGSLAVRMTVVTLMRKLELCVDGDELQPQKSAGRACVTKLNGFLLNIYETLNKELPDTSMAY